jgi:hypothetical protein
MKIVRFDSAGATRLGSLHADGRVTLLEGDMFGPLRDTGAVAKVDKLLAPLEPRDILCIGLNYKKHLGAPAAVLRPATLRARAALREPRCRRPDRSHPLRAAET